MKKPTKKPAAAKPEAGSTVQKPFPLKVNEARGEVPLWIGPVPLVLAAEMERLVAVSSRLQCRSLNDLYNRLDGVEVAATWAGIELLTVRGDWMAALQVLRLKHFGDCKAAFTIVLSHHFDGDEGNGEAVDQTA